MWGAGGGGSGDGSTLDYTATVRGLVSDVLTRYNVSSMLDSSCGSMHWMPLVLGEREKARADFRFMGTDVVCMLIDQHKQTFSNHTNWDFQVGWGLGLILWGQGLFGPVSSWLGVRQHVE